MWPAHVLHRDRRGGVVLDLIVGAALVLLGAFVLASAGITLGELLHGAGQFFGY
ncbi:MAG TPA: hypothetical protein VMG99_01605 [Thermoplasmata archaeon]|jgi:hypothetical protein|nr:hypothetical protein [Thermoplasmata archaeon]